MTVGLYPQDHSPKKGSILSSASKWVVFHRDPCVTRGCWDLDFDKIALFLDRLPSTEVVGNVKKTRINKHQGWLYISFCKIIPFAVLQFVVIQYNVAPLFLLKRAIQNALWNASLWVKSSQPGEFTLKSMGDIPPIDSSYGQWKYAKFLSFSPKSVNWLRQWLGVSPSRQPAL